MIVILGVFGGVLVVWTQALEFLQALCQAYPQVGGIGRSSVGHRSAIDRPLVGHWSAIGRPLVGHWSVIGQLLVSSTQ